MTDAAGGAGAGAGGAGAGADPWYGKFGETDAPEFQQWVGNKNYPDGKTALLSAFNQEKLLGADRAGRTVVLPKDENDVEGVKAFRAKLGVPEKADDYKLPVPEGMAPEFAATAASWFHKHGVPPAAARAIAGDWNTHIGEMVAAAQAQETQKSQADLDAVKGEWGANFEANAEIARRYMKATGLDSAQVTAIEQALGTATFLKTFHKLGGALGEAGFAGEGGSGFSANNAQIESQMADLRQKRAEGKVNEQDFHAQMDALRLKKAA